MMKKLIRILSLIPLAGTAAVYRLLPDKIPMHYDITGTVDRWGARYEAFFIPAAILLLTVFWTVLINVFEKKATAGTDEKARAGAASNAKVLSVAGAAMVAVMTGIQGFLLYDACRRAGGGATDTGRYASRLFCILLGALMIVLGNLTPKTRRHGVVGVRTKWSRYNDVTWRKTNRFGGAAMVTAGALTAAAAFLPNATAAGVAVLVLFAAALIATLAYSHTVYKKEKAAGNAADPT